MDTTYGVLVVFLEGEVMVWVMEVEAVLKYAHPVLTVYVLLVACALRLHG